MTSEVTNKHRIHVNARVRDTSGGVAYAFAFDQNPTITEIKLKIKRNKLMTTDMTEMGTFDAAGTTLTADVSEFIEWDSLTSGPNVNKRNLVNYNQQTNVGRYYVFMYAEDPFNNVTVVSHPQNPILMTTQTISLTNSFVLLSVGTTNYAEQRNNVPDPSVSLQTPLFDFYNGRTENIYAHLSVDPKDSVVNDVSVVAFSTQQLLTSVPSFSNKTEIYSVSGSPIFGSVKNDIAEVTLDRFFQNTLDSSEGTLFSEHFATHGYGKVFYVYAVMKDVGFDKWNVTEFVVPAGESPVLTGSIAEIVNV